VPFITDGEKCNINSNFFWSRNNVGMFSSHYNATLNSLKMK